MASIVNRKSSYAVVYGYYCDGKRKQKWECYKTEQQARQRKFELEHPCSLAEAIPVIITVGDLMEQYFMLYGTCRWAYSTMTNYSSLVRRYVKPIFGSIRVSELTTVWIAKIYGSLIKGSRKSAPITKSALRDLHKLMKSAFNQAVLWEVVEHNPFLNVTLPKEKKKQLPFWNADEIKAVLKSCDDPVLSTAIQLAFACSLRRGELLALKWRDVDFAAGTISVSKTMQRVSKAAVEFLGEKDILEIVPTDCSGSPNLVVLKRPKTESGIRLMYMPKGLAGQLRQLRSMHSGKTNDFVLCHEDGQALQPEHLQYKFRKLKEKCGARNVTFHSLRHSSVTYKLLLTNGDIKAVQGDTGHAQSKMVVEVYAEILDSERKKTADKIDADWYEDMNFLVGDQRRILPLRS